ncbi:ABC transporter permease [Dactylosporangium fulvum]|uniref:ABC transporter permease n=1 Tax=Dactylosporangium fulvum TaxID=53359 RepID=A0ABY5WAT6_9ACTN|nr:ABC transporter permease [Dactylosporangium fulvum]UWP86652.1 ABC transporter permease [Dactylosporangium fulvum]
MTATTNAPIDSSRSARRPAGSRNRRWRGGLGPIIVLVAIIGAWVALPSMSAVPHYVIPPLADVVSALTDPSAWPNYGQGIAATMSAVGIGLVIGVAVGLGLALLLAELPVLYRAIFPYIVAVEAIPKVALAPLFVIWFGFGLGSKLVVVVLLVFFPVLVNTVHGLREVDTDRIDLFRVAGASKLQRLWRLSLPTALPSIFSGLELAVSGAMVGAVVGEFVGAQQGLGVQILVAQARMDTAGVFALLILLSVIGVALNTLVRVLRRRVVFWVKALPAQTA